ncbi:LysR family transcriptional regulator [Neptunomonas marina]|uniref:LysR family transcriptional regulator n=1 Tax=Neptunomonas marina TaxID=1815562 RepID=A0A437QCG7_9GAMM|nr:LysR family transcriptional regulator [Neptunomonas marina]RVU32242.1 LysR family transcriptional regulator [Neptunomonas marina]
MSLKNYSLGQVGDFEIKQLRIFKSVVDNGGFSAAETDLNISRSTISIHISNLESRLNLTLCKRGRAGFSLTKEGAVVYEMTNKLLESLDEFRDVVNDMSQNPAGIMRILVSDGTSLDPRAKFPEMISRFSTLAPEIKLQSEVSYMAEIERMVLNDEVDVGLIPYHRQLDGLEYYHLYSDVCRLYCGRGNPLFDLPESEITDEVINQFTAILPGLKPHEEASAQLSSMSFKGTAYFYETRLAMILSGKFIAFLPENYAKLYVEEGQLRQVGGAERCYTLGIAAVIKKRAHQNRPTEIFQEIIRSFHPDSLTGAS